MSILGLLVGSFVGYSVARLLRKGYSKLSRRAKLTIAVHIFIPLFVLTLVVSGIGMAVAVINLFLGNWGAMSMGLVAAVLNGAGSVALGGVAMHFDDKLRLVDGRGPFKEPVQAKDRVAVRQPLEIAKPDPLYATWDQIIGFHTVEKVVADLPDSIRADFTQCSPFREATSVELAQAERVRGSIDRHVYAGGGMV